MRKKIKISVELPIEKTKDSVICYNARTVNMVFGSSSASGNQHLYKIKKLNNPMRWEIPLVELKRRIDDKERKIRKEQENLEIMKQIYKAK